jgi:hypothetical protein
MGFGGGSSGKLSKHVLVGYSPMQLNNFSATDSKVFRDNSFHK